MAMKQARIKAALEAFKPLHVQVENESQQHNVPAGSESHFKITVVSVDFEGKPLLSRHRAVYSALGALQQEVHALALHTLTPGEWAEKGGMVIDSPLCAGGSKGR